MMNVILRRYDSLTGIQANCYIQVRGISERLFAIVVNRCYPGMLHQRQHGTARSHGVYPAIPTNLEIEFREISVLPRAAGKAGMMRPWFSFFRRSSQATYCQRMPGKALQMRIAIIRAQLDFVNAHRNKIWIRGVGRVEIECGQASRLCVCLPRWLLDIQLPAH